MVDLNFLTHDGHNLPGWAIPSVNLACIHAENGCDERERELSQNYQPKLCVSNFRENPYENNRDNREHQ